MTQTINGAIRLGSETAKGGFRNEDDIILKFNNWKTDIDSKKWLNIMGYKLNEIESVTAVKVSGQKTDINARWVLKPMNVVLNYFGGGKVEVSPKGSIYIGKITVQRKGGDGGRPTANMLQFKINPAELFDI